MIVENIRAFCEREGITWSFFLSPARIYGFLIHHRFLQFFIVGSCGVGINLGVTWVLTTYVFGLPDYFFAFIFGIAANLAFNFTLYTIAIFKTKGGHLRRLVIFIVYCLAMTYVQAVVVKAVTPLIGLQYYLLVIAGTILVFSVVNFFVFKLSIFKQDTPPRV